MNTLKIQGKELPIEEGLVIPIERDDLTLTQVIDVSALRAGNDSVNINIENDDDIINIEFDDGGEWVGSAFDFTEIFGEKILDKRGGDGGIELPSALSGGDDRGLKEIGIKLISLFTRKETLAEIAAEKIGVVFDERSMPKPGLYSLEKDSLLLPYRSTHLQDQHFLLFIHGTASSTEGSFGSLSKADITGIWGMIHNSYEGNVLALEHRTVSVSPIQNAIDALKALPAHCSLDIISHSRGGIVADILARCDKRNDHTGFTKQELDKIEREDGGSLKLMEEINDLVRCKGISVNKIIRVACPAQGTTLLSERLDHFLNGLLRAIGLAFGGKANPLYQRVRSFIVDVIKARATPDVMPGLNAMIPDSPLQQVINNPHVLVKSHLAVIEGNSEVGGDIKHSILVIFSNLFYWAANDFVVNTQSMRYGARRENGYHLFLSQDNQTSHFNYFKNENSQKALKDAIHTKAGESINGYAHNRPQSDGRGIALSSFDMGEVARNQISGSKPIVILLPGIMGSNLEVNGKKIWLDFEQIKDGKIKTRLSADGKKIEANSLIANYYNDFVLELLKHYDVHTFAFDWRLSLKTPASELNKLIQNYTKEFSQPIKIVAHSMGGLVVRQMMLDHSDDWTTYISQQDSQFMMLGTPWLGSYMIMEVLTGYSKRIKQLAFLDFESSHRELLDVFVKYDGLYELLPIDDRDFENQAFWKSLEDELGEKNFPIPELKELDSFKAYKDSIKNTAFDFTNVYYIAGKKNTTVTDYAIKKSWFNTKIRFISTPHGDGSVTWDSGIPKNLPAENVYYTNTEHGELANDTSLFDGIIELLKEGSTSHFQQSRPVSRAINPALMAQDDSTLSNDLQASADIIFGIDRSPTTYTEQVDEIEVSVTHGHLKTAQYPLMVGHFLQDGIVSAERTLDESFAGKLLERHLFGIYPGDIGESEVLIIPENNPVGAIVIGLGDNTQLTAYNLMKSIEQGVINYAMHLRDSCHSADNTKFSHGISSLCIGSSYGSLPMENALSAILNGINRANARLKDLSSDIQNITKVEIIELYEHVARKAYFTLKKIQKNPSELRIKVGSFNTRYGGKKKLDYAQEVFWWHNFTTEFAKNKNKADKPRLIFKSSSGIARVEEETLFPAQPVVDALLKDMSTKSKWDIKLSKTLFEILIPNSFKEIIRTQNNILWKLDIDTAAYPWEMFHDSDSDKDPTFINAGLIRQLATESYRPTPKMIRTNQALVIGDPLYTGMGLPQLPAAKKEAEIVAEKLCQENFQVEEMIGKQGVDIINSIFNTEYKVLHVAGHGIYNPKEDQVGAALGNDMFLSPDLINSLPKVPEFVFINCCYSGVIDSAFEKYYQNRYKLAANLGTQLIQMGVNAVVITGWAVDDSAAEVFSSTLYEKMLAGHYFGDSVVTARKKCYQEFKHTNTWGAYQCYGDPWYKLVKKSPDFSEAEEYISEQQVVVDLCNLMSWSVGGNRQDLERIHKKLNEIIKRAKKHAQYTGAVIEKEAEIYASIDEIELAVDRYQTLLQLNKATFSVKSLEQFCNLRAKLLVKNKETDKQIITKLLSVLMTLLLIGKTPERLCILGSAYKRIAQLAVDDNDKKNEHLEEMADYYQQAYELLPPDQSDSIYPLTNWLTALALKKDSRKIEINGKSLSHKDHLLKIESTFKLKTAVYEDFWNDIHQVNILMCIMLFTKNAKEINHLKCKIITLYKDAWDMGGNYKHARTEIEHIEFIQTIWSSESSKQKILKALEEVRRELVGLMG